MFAEPALDKSAFHFGETATWKCHELWGPVMGRLNRFESRQHPPRIVTSCISRTDTTSFFFSFFSFPFREARTFHEAPPRFEATFDIFTRRGCIHVHPLPVFAIRPNIVNNIFLISSPFSRRERRRGRETQMRYDEREE